MLAVFKKELHAYYSSLTGYIFMGFFLFISALYFVLHNLQTMSPDYNGVLGNITFIFLLVVPILTMKLMSEETRQKTDQLLLTSPLKLASIVVGKYLAALTVFLLTLVITLIYPIILSTMGELAVAEIIGGYIGFFFLGAAFIAIGLFVSSLTENQAIAAIVTFGLLLLIWIIDGVKQVVPMDRMSGMIFTATMIVIISAVIYFSTKNIPVSAALLVIGLAGMGLMYTVNAMFFDALMFRILAWISLLARYTDFKMGLLRISPIVYYISFSGLFLFLTIRILEKRRWS